MPRVCRGGRCWNVPAPQPYVAPQSAAQTNMQGRSIEQMLQERLNNLQSNSQQSPQYPQAIPGQTISNQQPIPLGQLQGLGNGPSGPVPQGLYSPQNQQAWQNQNGQQNPSDINPASANIQSQVVPYPGQSGQQGQQQQQSAPFWPPRGLEWFGGPGYWALRAALPKQTQGISDKAAGVGNKLYEGAFGKDPLHLLFPQFNPDQESVLNQFLQQGQQGLNNANFDFGPIEQRARTQFQQETVPSLAERFTNFGQGSQRSSAFSQQLGKAGAGLEEGLASLRTKYNIARFPQLMQLAQTGLQPRYTSALQPGTPGFFGGLAAGAGQGIGSVLPALLGGLL